MIDGWPRRSPATAIWPIASTSSPTSRRFSASSRSASVRIDGPPCGFGTQRRRLQSLPSRARPRSCRTSARRSSPRSWRSSRRGIWRRSRSVVHEVPGEVASFMRLPGLGPKTAARIWRELGVTTLAELKAAAEGERLRTLAGIGGGTEAKILKALAEGQGSDEPRRGLLGGRAARRARGRRDTACAPCRGRRVRSGEHAPPSRDVPRSRRDRDRDRSCGADGALRRAALGARGRRPRRHQGNGDHEPGPAARPPGRPARELRRSAPALHGLEGAQRGPARASPAPRAIDFRVRRHGGRDGRGEDVPGRGVALRLPRLQLHPARAARERRRARSGPRWTTAAARRGRRPSRRDALPFDLVGGREGVDRGDGGGRGGARLRVPLPDRPLALPAGGKDRGAVARDRGGQRPVEALPGAARDRGEHHCEGRGRRRRRHAGASSTGWSHRCTPRSTALRPSVCWPPWTTRTWTASGI